MENITIQGAEYRIGTLNARSQFHIVRRLAPFLQALTPAFAEGGDKDKLTAMLPIFGDAISNMSDETADYVIFGLLSVVSKKESSGIGWAPICKNGALMLEDITMALMLTLAGKSLVKNLSGFFSELRTTSESLSQN